VFAGLRVVIALMLAAVSYGCATLPEVHPWATPAGAPRKATIVGSRGELSRQRSEAVRARLAKTGSDLLTRHLVLEEEVAGAPLTVGNTALLLRDGPPFYDAMFAAIAGARDHVNVEFYIIEDDEVGRRFSEALIQKAAEGVAVNLMYDSAGSFGTPRAFFDRLRAAGVNVLEYNPLNPLNARGDWLINNRNHRKVAIIDGRIGFTGGINISGVYASGSSPTRRGRVAPAASGSGSGAAFGSRRGSDPVGASRVGWRDTHIRIDGPAVAQMQRLFLDTWSKQRGEPLAEREWFPTFQGTGPHPVRIIASGPGDAVPAIYTSLLAAIAFAEKSVHITMAYFVPDPQTMQALKDAAARGVDVTLVLPSHTDFWVVFHAARSHYSELLGAGVKIYERGTALLHAKTVVIDGVWSTIGSANLDWRSFLHNAELNAVILGADFGKELEAMFESDLRESTRIEPAAWERRPIDVRMKEWTARLWAYWL
jgi:cardiolipin synthase